MSIAAFFVGIAVGFILGLVFVAVTASTFGRRRTPPTDRTWPKPPAKEER